MNYASLNLCDSSNGDGFRVSLFVSGCTLACEGCFNREAWNFKYGKPFDKKTMVTLLEGLAEPHIDGLSILGGDPLESKHFWEVYLICKEVKETFPDKNIWLWTGRTLEEILTDESRKMILRVIDVLVDGRFVQHLKDESLMWRGSSNQRIIYVNKSNLIK